MVKALPTAELLTGYQGSLCLTSMDSDLRAPKVEHHMTRSKLFRELPPINMRHIKRRCLPHSMILRYHAQVGSITRIGRTFLPGCGPAPRYSLRDPSKPDYSNSRESRDRALPDHRRRLTFAIACSVLTTEDREGPLDSLNVGLAWLGLAWLGFPSIAPLLSPSPQASTLPLIHYLFL